MKENKGISILILFILFTSASCAFTEFSKYLGLDKDDTEAIITLSGGYYYVSYSQYNSGQWFIVIAKLDSGGGKIISVQETCKTGDSVAYAISNTTDNGVIVVGHRIGCGNPNMRGLAVKYSSAVASIWSVEFPTVIKFVSINYYNPYLLVGSKSANEGIAVVLNGGGTIETEIAVSATLPHYLHGSINYGTNNYIVGFTTTPDNGNQCLFYALDENFLNTASAYFGGTGAENCYGISAGVSGNLFIVGDTTSAGKGGIDGYLLKISPTGTIIYEKTFGSVENDYFRKITSMGDNTMTIVGHSKFGSTYYKPWVINIDSNCNEIYSYNDPGINSDYLDEEAKSIIYVDRRLVAYTSQCHFHINNENDACIYVKNMVCTAGHYLVTTSCCRECNKGEYQNLDQQISCKYCEIGTYANVTASKACIDCPAGYSCPSKKTIDPEPCIPNTCQPFTKQDSCLPCPAGQSQPLSGQTQCHKCFPGHIIYGSSCKSCIAGTYQDKPDQIFCKDSPTGNYIPFDEAIDYTPCPSGHYQNLAGKSFCNECDAGTYQNLEGQTSCKQCDYGTYQESKGSIICEDCEAGTYQNVLGGKTCKLCPAGYFQGGSGANNCIPCAPGTSQPTEGQAECIACQPGTYSKNPGTPNCNECLEGYYQSQEGSTECFPCPEGTKSNSKKSKECTDCYWGEYNNSPGQADCKLCPVGTAHKLTKMISCPQCSIGTFQSKTGQFSCDLCPIGHYQDLEGQANCKSCPAGKYQGYEGKITCLECELGQYQDLPGQGECKPCPAGYFANNKGSATCKKCPVGWYQDLDGGSFCKECTSGYYQDQEGQNECKMCEIGKFQDSTKSTICKLCPVMTYQDEPGKAKCKPCDPGFYQDSTGQSKCLRIFYITSIIKKLAH